MQCFRGGRRISAWQAVTQLLHTSIGSQTINDEPGTTSHIHLELGLHGTQITQEYQPPQCSTLDMESSRIQLQCILHLPMHKCHMRAKESQLCMIKFLFQAKLNYFYLGFWFLFSGISSGFILLGFGSLFYYFFYLNIHFFVSFYPRQEQEGYSCGMTEILT